MVLMVVLPESEDCCGSVIVNASGRREFGGNWMAEGHGTIDKRYAERDAETWRERTLWPVFDLGRQ